MSGCSKSSSFTLMEKKILCNLIGKYRVVIENKKTDATTCDAKKKTWLKIREEYNSHRYVVKKSEKQLKRCWEKIKWMEKKKRSEKMGTGGEPPLSLQYDPITITDQVEAIAPQLDIKIEESFDSDYHHQHKISTSTEPFPYPTSISTASTGNAESTSNLTSTSSHAFHNSPEPSCASSVVKTTPIIPSCSTGEANLILPSTSSSLQAMPSFPEYPSCNDSLSASRSYFLSSPVPADQPCSSQAEPAYNQSSPETLPSIKVGRVGEKVKVHLQIAEKELKARLAMMEEEMEYLRTLYTMKIRRSQEKDRIVAENLREATATRMLAEAQLKKLKDENGMIE